MKIDMGMVDCQENLGKGCLKSSGGLELSEGLCSVLASYKISKHIAESCRIL